MGWWCLLLVMRGCCLDLQCSETYVGVGLVSISSCWNQGLGTRLGLLVLSHLGAAYSLHNHHRQWYNRRHYHSQSPHLVECILNIDRRIRNARTRPPTETLASVLSSPDPLST